MQLAYKRVPFDLKAVTDGETGWEIAGLASTWWGEPDAYGDVVAPGAFAESIAARATKFFYEHWTPIGKQLELAETDDGLYGRWSVIDTIAGTDAYKLAKAGILDSLSIGYVPLEWEMRADGARILRKVDLYEVSCVALPANEHAVITAVKAAGLVAAPPAEPAPAPAVSRPLPVAPSLSLLALDLDRIRARLLRRGLLLAESTS